MSFWTRFEFLITSSISSWMQNTLEISEWEEYVKNGIKCASQVYMSTSMFKRESDSPNSYSTIVLCKEFSKLICKVDCLPHYASLPSLKKVSHRS
jgi:hypothetical protein